MFDKKQKSCVKRIHLVTDDGLYDRKAFYTVKIVFYSSSVTVSTITRFICSTFVLEFVFEFVISSFRIRGITIRRSRTNSAIFLRWQVELRIYF